MQSKDILIVSRSFYPKNSPRSFRTTELALELARMKHKVTVLIPDEGYDYTGFEKDNHVTVACMGKLPPLYDQISGKGFANRIKKTFRGILKYFFEYPRICLSYMVWSQLHHQKKYDLLISIGSPHAIHWGVAWFFRKEANKTCTWIADCGDPYMGSKRNRYGKRWYFKYLEHFFCRRADYITIPFDDAKNAYYEEYRDKIRVIPQGFHFDPADIAVNDPAEDAVTNVSNKVVTFAFAGTLLADILFPDPFFRFLAAYKHPFKFVIFTNKESWELILTSFGRNTENLEYRGIVDRVDLLRELRNMDFLINVNNRSRVHRPSKLIDYAIAGRPVLSIDPDHFDERKFTEFMKGNYDDAHQIEDIEQYHIRTVARKFLSLS